MKYSNEECNSNNSTYATECQPSFDTCVTIVLKPGKDLFLLFFCVIPFDPSSSYTQSIIDYEILYKTSCL